MSKSKITAFKEKSRVWRLMVLMRKTNRLVYGFQGDCRHGGKLTIPVAVNGARIQMMR